MTDIERMSLEILARIAKRNIDELETDFHLVGDLSIDSPKALALICDIEDDLGLEFPDSAMDQLNTVGDLLAMIRNAAAATQNQTSTAIEGGSFAMERSRSDLSEATSSTWAGRSGRSEARRR